MTSYAEYLSTRLNLLKQLVKSKSTLENKILGRIEEEKNITDAIQNIQAPVVKEVEKITRNQSNPKEIEITNYSDYYEPFSIDLSNINKKLAKSIIPRKGTLIENNKQFDTLEINHSENNKNRHVLVKVNKVKYIINYDKAKDDYKPYTLTHELENLIKGHGSNSSDDIDSYLKMLSETGLKGNAGAYVKGLKSATNSPRTSGNGLFCSPLSLFVEFRKLLAAKKAGHNNVYNDVNDILKQLLEHKYITTEKYKKILSKYFNKNGRGNDF